MTQESPPAQDTPVLADPRSRFRAVTSTTEAISFLGYLRWRLRCLRSERQDVLSDAGLEALESRIEPPEAERQVLELRGLFESCRSIDEEAARLIDEPPKELTERVGRSLASLRDRLQAAIFLRPRIKRVAGRLATTALASTEAPEALVPYRRKIEEIDAEVERTKALINEVKQARAEGRPWNPAAVPAPAPPSNGIRVAARNLSVRAGVLRILRDISLEVRPGECVGVLGPSGSGKSTLLGALNGTRPARVGSVLYEGQDFYQNFRHYRSMVGYVPQDDIIHQALSVRRALIYGAMLRQVGDGESEAISKRVDEVLEIVELTDRQNVPIRSLSGGQRKRVSLAMELLADPPLLFLDEPTSGLDPALEEKMMQLFRKRASDGGTVIVTTHLMDSLDVLDHVAILREGRLVYFGPPREALPFFGVERFKDIYQQLDAESAEGWERRLREMPFYQERANGTVSPSPSDSPSDSDTPSETETAAVDEDTRPDRRFDPEQYGTLASRHLEILRSDTRSTAILLLQAPVIGLLLWMTGPTAPTLLFIMVLAAFWFGCSNAVREIVKENAIYARERMVVLKILPYVGSKMRNLSGLCVIQCVTLLLIGPLGSWANIGGVGTAPLLLGTMILTAFAGTALGLVISGLVRSSDKAVSLVPIVILPQILLSGVLVPLEDMGVLGKSFSWMCPMAWSYGFLEDYHLLDEWSGVFETWGILVAFVLVFLAASCVLLKRQDSLT